MLLQSHTIFQNDGKGDEEGIPIRDDHQKWREILKPGIVLAIFVFILFQRSPKRHNVAD
jgi:hypothetical protein